MEGVWKGLGFFIKGKVSSASQATSQQWGGRNHSPQRRPCGSIRGSYPGRSPLADRGSGGLEEADMRPTAIGLVLLFGMILESSLGAGLFTEPRRRLLFSMNWSVTSKVPGATTYDAARSMDGTGAAEQGQQRRGPASGPAAGSWGRPRVQAFCRAPKFPGIGQSHLSSRSVHHDRSNTPSCRPRRKIPKQGAEAYLSRTGDRLWSPICLPRRRKSWPAKGDPRRQECRPGRRQTGPRKYANCWMRATSQTSRTRCTFAWHVGGLAAAVPGKG